MKILNIFMIFMLGLSVSLFSSCEKKTSDKAEEVIDDMKDTAEDIGEDIQDTAEDIGDKAEDMAEEVEEEMEEEN